MGIGLVFIICSIFAVNVHADVVTLEDIQKAIHGLSLMMEKTWPPKSINSLDRKPVFDLFTCLTLTKDLELLVFNRTEIILEDMRQTCSCRRVKGKFESQLDSLTSNSTFTTDLFIHVLLTTISNSTDSDSLSQSFTHFTHPSFSTRKNVSHVHELREPVVRLTAKENLIQVITRFLIKSWAVKVTDELRVPIFELYTCASLLQQVEQFVDENPQLMKSLKMSPKQTYVPCSCNRLYELASTSCEAHHHCSVTFSPVHTRFEQKLRKITEQMSLPPEITLSASEPLSRY